MAHGSRAKVALSPRGRCSASSGNIFGCHHGVCVCVRVCVHACDWHLVGRNPPETYQTLSLSYDAQDSPCDQESSGQHLSSATLKTQSLLLTVPRSHGHSQAALPWEPCLLSEESEPLLSYLGTYLILHPPGSRASPSSREDGRKLLEGRKHVRCPSSPTENPAFSAQRLAVGTG